jgi:C2H2-type zinc finger
MSETYRCDLCGDRFASQDDLRAHWEATHDTASHQPIGATVGDARPPASPSG